MMPNPHPPLIPHDWSQNVAITAVLDLHVKPELVAQAPAALHTILVDTRAFDGCLGVEVLVELDDPAHIVVVERWASEDHDAAYRAWRAGDGQSNLASFLAEPPALTKYSSSDEI